MLNFINGGVCAAQGFKAAGVHMGVKSHKTDKKDVALIVSDVECSAAAVFTKNAVKAAPIHVDKEHLKNGKAKAIIVNSGNANACAPQGEENAKRMCVAAAKVHEALCAHYAGCAMVSVAPIGGDESVIYASTKAGQDNLRIIVCGHETQTTVTALFDNLGKGASGAAVQNMNIVLGFDETTGLSVE